MNIVKGVAGLIWRSSSGQTEQYHLVPASGRFPPPKCHIVFSEVGDEAILKELLEKYLSVADDMGKRKALHIFLKQFLKVFQSWSPLNLIQTPGESNVILSEDNVQNVGDVVVGCRFGHPDNVILALIDEISFAAKLLTESQLGFTTNLGITAESFLALDALIIATLSSHNCKVFGHHAGVQKITSLMKAAVVQLRTITGALPLDSSSSDSMEQIIRNLQKILYMVVSVVYNFVNFPSRIEGNFQLDPPIHATILSWHQSAIVSVMEAGGLNWLVEVLRLVRRLILKEQWIEMSLQHLTLQALQSVLSDNSRGQNHFRSIGGLEVLLDGLGVSVDSLAADDSLSTKKSAKYQLHEVFDLHVLSLEVLREAVFGNFGNLQFLCENGRVQKFANSFCSFTFIIQDDKFFKSLSGGKDINEVNREKTAEEVWNDYVSRLCSALCHFLLEAEELKICSIQKITSRDAIVLSPVYTELSLKWFMKVLLTIFPVVRACSDENKIPVHMRIFAMTLQRYVLFVFKKVLLSLPSLLDVFRAEGLWDLIFSENFFYFSLAPAECSSEWAYGSVASSVVTERNNPSSFTEAQVNVCDDAKFQHEVISFIEYASTLSGSTNNLPECSALLDALEHSTCNPKLATALAKSLLHILQLTTEKTLASFKTLDAISRFLKVACIQVQESRRCYKTNSISQTVDRCHEFSQNTELSCSPELAQRWENCLGILMELFESYFSVSEDTKHSILHNPLCISCIFDLFWEEGIRNLMLKCILELMKVVPTSDEDQKGKVLLCSKYFAMFTKLKERGMEFTGPSVELLVAVRELLLTDKEYYQALFRESECFLHVLSLLNGNMDADKGEILALNVIQTLTCLLSINDLSKAAFRALVGDGYQTFRSLLLDFYQWNPSEALLNALLDMLVDGNFDPKLNCIIQNEDVIMLYLNVLRESSDSLQHYGLDVFHTMLRDSLSNRASCVRAGMLNFLLNWVSQKKKADMLLKMSPLIELIGSHSISGKDIRKIFAMLRGEKTYPQEHVCSTLLTTMLTMMNEKGPTSFFDLNGLDSGIVLRSPIHFPVNKGFSFTCWLRVERFPTDGPMALFSFLTENGRGCFAVLDKEKLIYESINQKRQCVVVNFSAIEKKWHFICLVHSVGRAFSGGSQLKCYFDGVLVSTEKCRYPKVSDAFNCCTIGIRINPVMLLNEEENSNYSIKDCYPFYGQIGPLYLFSDAISPELVQGICSLGPSYMYYFSDHEISVYVNKYFSGGVLDAKVALASKVIIGLNAQASNGRALFNVASSAESVLERENFGASMLVGTQLCSRRLLQQIIYCVGGVSVFFPLLVQFDMPETVKGDQLGGKILSPSVNGRFINETIRLIASVLDENSANQQHMLQISGFSVLGFLLLSMPAKLITLETLSALKQLFSVVTNGGLAQLLVKDAVFSVFLNPQIWVRVVYKVQRELYMFLIQKFDDDPKLLQILCSLPHLLDIIQKFYSDTAEGNVSLKNKVFFHATGDTSGVEKLDGEEIRKIRLLLFSLGEMTLSQDITTSDVKALVAFCTTCQDMACLEDILNMIIRVTCQQNLLSSFIDHVNSVGGCVAFANLLGRDYEHVRLLGLQLIARLFVGTPVGKKGSKYFSISVGRSKYLTEGHGKNSLHMQAIFSFISDMIFEFPLTDLLCATLFDVLLGGASPKQVLRRINQSDREKGEKCNGEFVLPQVLPLIFRFLSGCEDASSRMKIMGDLLDLLYSYPSNIDAFMDNGWNAWLAASVKLDVIKNYKFKKHVSDVSEIDEKHLVMNMYTLILLHRILSMKSGWQDLEGTANFLMSQSEQVGMPYQFFLRDLYEDLIQNLISVFSEENNFVSTTCRDNTLYLVKLVDEVLICEMGYRLPFPSRSIHFPQFLETDGCPDICDASFQVSREESSDGILGSSVADKQFNFNEEAKGYDDLWTMYDKLWILLGKMNEKQPSKVSPRSSSITVPSLSQRARGLVESLNIPAAEMAATVSGGISSALVGKSSKSFHKVMQLRGEACSRFVNRLIIFYLCRSSLERASQCVQQVVHILPLLLAADDEQNTNRLQFFIWTLLVVRSQYGVLDGGARFHVISSLIRETINYGKPMLVTSLVGADDFPEFLSSSKQWSTILNFIQKDRLIATVADEEKYIKNVKTDRISQLDELCRKMEENVSIEFDLKKALGVQMDSSLQSILVSDENRKSLFQLSVDEDQQAVAERWIHTLRFMVDERGPWSANSIPNTTVLHWKLDKAEDTWRRRLKFRRNYHFNEKLCYPSSSVLESMAVSSTNNSKAGFEENDLENIKQLPVKGIWKISDEDPNEPVGSDAQHTNLETGESTVQHSEVKTGSPEQVIAQESLPSVNKSDNTEVLLIIPCVLVTPKRKIAGRMAIMKELLHFYGEHLVEGTGGSSALKNYYSSGEINSGEPEDLVGVQRQMFVKWKTDTSLDFKSSSIDENIDSVDRDKGQKMKNCIKRHRSWNMSTIKAVHWTRYLLQYTAIEIFFINSMAPIFFNFASQKVAKTVGSLIVSTRNEYMSVKGLKDRTATNSFVDRRLAQEMAETAKESWRRRDITNFEYLMILNTLAGRSYNDITQYPVFPWVLADYWSDTLDLKKSSTFRDLTKPIGALDPKRFEVFEDRYHNFVDPDIPSFYYGSHYSSMGIVLFYLLRLEPFTELHRTLQGGKFDHADRLFQSIEGTFKNCLSNTSDVKELIPEFFYMPEFLINSNSYHFGIKQDGEPIGDVCLPPWAQGSPYEFITKNREALESEYVSSNLHHWIDLIFGYKQRGKPAIEAANVFYHLTYEGSVDLDNMEDELQRLAIEDQIANFGQTPIQIFRKKHPRRGPPIPIAHPLRFAPTAISLTSVVPNMKNSTSAIVSVEVFDTYIVTVSQDLVVSVKLWLTTDLQSGGNFTFSGSQDPFFGIGSDVFSPCKIGRPRAENFELVSQCFTPLQTPSENFLISCGNWESSFQITSLSNGRTVQSVRYHKDIVSCVSVTADGSFLATGSYDTTVMVWEFLQSSRAFEKRSRNPRSHSKDCIIAESPLHILCGHDDVISCLHASSDLDLVISGSKDGTCILHTLREGRYVRSLCHPSGRPVAKLAVSRHGRIVLYADDLNLQLYSINGKHISSAESNGRLRSLEVSKCGDFLVCAGEHGQIVVRSMNSLDILMKYAAIGKTISSLCVTSEECFVAGTKDGNLLVYSVEPPLLKKPSLQQNLVSKPSVA